MGFFNWFGSGRDSTEEQRALTINSFAGATDVEVIDYGTGNDTDGELFANEYVALQSSCFYGAVNYIAKIFATLSFGVYLDTDNGREKQKGHRAYRLLTNPSPLYSGYSWRHAAQAQFSTYGDTVTLIESPYSNPTLLLAKPGTVRLQVYGDEPTYIVNGRTYTADQVLHVHGFSLDGTGICPTTPVAAAKRLLGLSLAAEDFGRSFFANGATMGVTYTSPTRMKPEDKLQFLAMKDRQHRGSKKAFKGEILDAGMTKSSDGVEPEKGQFLQTQEFVRKQLVSEIFHLPPSLFDLGNARSTEDEGILIAQNCILPIVKNWEGELNRKLLTVEEQQQGFYIEFNLDSLNRANLATRFNSYSVGRQIGLYSINQLADKENLPHVEQHGDDHFVPLNWISTDQIKDPPASNAPKNNPNTLSKMSSEQPKEVRSDILRFDNLLQDAAWRVLTKEIKAVERASKKFLKDSDDPSGFRTWAEEFYTAHADTIKQTFSPVIETAFGERAGIIIDKYREQHVLDSRADLALALWSNDPAAQIETTLVRWEERAKQIAKQLLEEDGKTN